MNPFVPLAQRVLAEEEMDAADLSDADYARVLTHLARINRLTLAQRPTLAFICRHLAQRAAAAEPMRILDVGFGAGDMLRAIRRTAVRMGRTVALTGIDLNARSAPVAAAATPAGQPIRWLTGDYRDLADEPWDIVISSLVAHHMTSEQRVAFLAFMERHARVGWLVNDLHRRRLPFVGYPALAVLAGVGPIVRRDGQLSIARSFRRDEWHADLAKAGIAHARVDRWFPWRLVVTRDI